MRPFMLLSASALALAGANPAAGQPRAPMCNLSAYYLNGARLDVRAGPSANAHRLQTRPFQGSPVAEITGQSGAWFRVSRITDYEDDTVLFELKPGELRIRSASAPVELGSGDVEVHPGSGAEIEIGTGERFAIGSGTLVLNYDPALLLQGAEPTVTADPRHGLANLTIDTSIPGTIEIDIESPDGSLNSEVPGDLLVVHLPTDPAILLGTDSPLTFGVGTELFDPSQAPIDVFFEGGFLQFRSDPGIFTDNFGIGDFGWWQLHP